ncbi:hypothetical protein P261_02765 [Lachnospiraceae bacterium TWA4]|nr:hypothetical protein P261_02765 [Lachnospiraceae bacterium TWA4]
MISAYFDKEASKEIERLIQKVYKATGNTFMIEHKVPPHLTLAAIQAREEKSLISAFYEITSDLSSKPIDIVSVGMFLPYVVYITPVLNQYLLDISYQISEQIKQISDASISKCYQTMNWLPHITIGKTLTSSQMKKALEVMMNNFVPFKAEVCKIGLAKVNPYEDIETVCLYP